MKISEPVPFIINDAPARMVVMRNQGYCWGHVIVDGEVPFMFDIHTAKHSFLDEDEEDAAAQFIELAQGHAIWTEVLA